MNDQLETPRDWRQRWALLIGRIEQVQTTEQKLQLLNSLSHPQKPYTLAFVNAHAMNSVATSASFFCDLYSADMVLRDGSGMAALFSFMRQPPGLNLNGTDLIPQIVRRFNKRTIAIFGTRNPYLEQGAQAIMLQFAPQSTCIRAHGFLDSAAYVKLAAKHRPELILLGMGMPKQEDVATALRSTLTYPCLIVCGGAIIDFVAGKMPRAPRWVRKIGMEWIFRLILEPRRLFRRYVIGNPLFVARVLRFVFTR